MIGDLLQRGGFYKKIAGEDFGVAVKAVTESINSGRGLFLTGTCGCGKTHLLKTLFKFPFSSPKYWVDCGDPTSVWLLDPKQNSRFTEMLSTNLFLDDLGTEIKVEYGRRSDWVGEFIRMYHARGTRRLFISTNLTGEQLLDKYDLRIADRIMDMCVVCRMSGISKRPKTVIV